MRTLAIFFSTAAVLAACSHSRGPDTPKSQGPTQTTISSFDFGDPGGTRRNAEPYTPSKPDLDDPHHPANRLATAACDRKLECDQVGVGRAYATRQACLSAAVQQAQQDLGRANCNNGMADGRLSECIHSVRRGACSTDFVMADRFLECRGDHLCAD